MTTMRRAVARHVPPSLQVTPNGWPATSKGVSKMETIEEAQTAVDKAQATFDRITERYNREYRAGLWSTNRPLAAASENAYDALHRAKVALAVFDEPACPHCDRTGVYIGRDITPGECLSEHRR